MPQLYQRFTYCDSKTSKYRRKESNCAMKFDYCKQAKLVVTNRLPRSAKSSVRTLSGSEYCKAGCLDEGLSFYSVHRAMVGLQLISIDFATIVALLLFSFAQLVGGSLVDMPLPRGTRVGIVIKVQTTNRFCLLSRIPMAMIMSARSTLSNRHQTNFRRMNFLGIPIGDRGLGMRSFASQIMPIRILRQCVGRKEELKLINPFPLEFQVQSLI